MITQSATQRRTKATRRLPGTSCYFAITLCSLVLLFLAACEDKKPASDSTSAESAPKQQPLPAKATAILETSQGKLTCELFPKDTPQAVSNFIGLAEGTHEWRHPLNGRIVHFHLYDGTVFHRVIPGFMIQGGDPKGDGTGDPGYKFKDEIVGSLRFDRAGRMAFANTGPNTNGSQFFITEKATPHLDGKFTIFGQCDAASVALVKKIARMPRDTSNDRPFNPVKIEKVTIVRQ